MLLPQLTHIIIWLWVEAVQDITTIIRVTVVVAVLEDINVA
jgi:hypothetical protein